MSTITNDRNRPYSDQPHTAQGLRGETEVTGITMRDLQDCLIQAFLASASPESGLQKKTAEISSEFQNTEFACDETWER